MSHVLERISSIEPYTPSEICEGEVKLDAQENPYELPQATKKKILKELASLSLNRYPDPESARLREKIAFYSGIGASGIILGNGSDELIYLLLSACGGPGKLAVSCEPTFSMYRILSQLTGTSYKGIPLDGKFSLSAEKILEISPDIVFIAYPNNPTGNCFPRNEIESLLADKSSLVVVDEAYYEFSGKTCADMLKRCSNLVILRTFSKAFSLAGIRAGYLLANPSLILQLRKAQLPYGFSMVNQKILEIVMEDRKKVLASVRKIIDSREKMFKELKGIRGITPYVSDANFILMRIGEIGPVLTGLRRNNIKVREFSDPGLRDFLRVTVGTEDENRGFLKAIREAV